MGGHGARGQRPSAGGLLLLLLCGTAAAGVPLDTGPAGQGSVEAAEGRRNGLLTFLAWWHEWTSQASSRTLVGGEASEVSRRQEGPPLPQPPRQDKKPCKNFFWKTFSSCK